SAPLSLTRRRGAQFLFRVQACSPSAAATRHPLATEFNGSVASVIPAIGIGNLSFLNSSWNTETKFLASAVPPEQTIGTGFGNTGMPCVPSKRALMFASLYWIKLRVSIDI